MDVLRYLYKGASPFAALSETELLLRTLINGPDTKEPSSLVMPRHANVQMKCHGPPLRKLIKIRAEPIRYDCTKAESI